MANAFVTALMNPSFKFHDIKEKNITPVLDFADEICGYINKYLPYQFSERNGRNEEDEESENQINVKHLPTIFGTASRAKTIEELHERIEKLRGKKVTYKDKLLKKGLKNRLKKKQKLEERKQTKNANRKQEYNQEELPTPDVKDSIKIEEKPKNVTENNIQFSKIIISKDDNKSTNKVTDPKRILQQMEKKNKKLQKLESKGKKEILRDIKTKESWNAAMKKVEGTKIKDNVELLKKSISKIKQRKIKSKKKWEERENTVKASKEEAQKKRQENIKKKRDEKTKKKTKALVKKGRILPR